MKPLLFLLFRLGALVAILPAIFRIGKASDDGSAHFVLAFASNESCAAQ
jgi:hypothetical protein